MRRPTTEEISDLYEEATERAMDGTAPEFVDGVKAALGWVLGQETQPELE